MLRAILVLVGIIVLIVVALMALGMLRIEKQGDAALPTVRFNVEGGHLPRFSAQTGSVGIGTTNRTVELPTVEMQNTTVTLPTIRVEKAGTTKAGEKTDNATGQ